MTNTHKAWTVTEASAWGPEDPDIWRPYILAKQIVEYLDATDGAKDKVDFAADRIKDELETALVHYQTITAVGFVTLNLSRQRAAYESLYSDLWTLYKDRMQKYLKEMGLNIGFMFAKNEKDFKEYANIFKENNQDNTDFVSFANTQRTSWQNDFAKYRIAHEHEGDLRGNIKDFDNRIDAKRLFAQVCWTMETAIASLSSYKLRYEWNIIDNSPKSTVFDRCERFVIEHTLVTQQKEQRE